MSWINGGEKNQQVKKKKKKNQKKKNTENTDNSKFFYFSNFFLPHSNSEPLILLHVHKLKWLHRSTVGNFIRKRKRCLKEQIT